MSSVALATWVLVGVTAIYVVLIGREKKQSEKATLLQIRYRLESDVTQIRMLKAQLLIGPSTNKRIDAWEKLEKREKQCSDTIDEVAKRIEKLEKRFRLGNLFKSKIKEKR